MDRRDFLRKIMLLPAAAYGIAPLSSELERLLWPGDDHVAPKEGESLPIPLPLFPEKPPGLPMDGANPLFLTFDDGPADWTGAILDSLAERKQTATFFVIGKNLTNPRLRRFAIRAVLEGHELGNHSYTHPSFSSISSKSAEREITDTHKLIKEIIEEAGVNSTRQNLFFRFPFGDAGSGFNYRTTSEVLARLGYRIAWWDLDTSDWRMEVPFYGTGPSRVIGSLKKAKAGDVVLMHDRRKTAAVLPSILDVIDAKNMVSCPLSSYDVIEEHAQADKALGSSSGKRRQSHVPSAFEEFFAYH